MATFSNCLQIINAMPERDQDALLARLDELQAQGLSPKEAQLQAAIDVLAQVEREGGIRKSASRVTDTPAFKRWSGGAPVIGLGDEHEFRSGQPVVVEALHGTTNDDIKEFKREKANIESDFGAGFYSSNTPEDVALNYANNDGADLSARIARLAERIEQEDGFDGDYDEAERIARSRLSGGAPNTMKLYVRFKNPAVSGGKGETVFDYEFDEDGEQESGAVVDFLNAMRELAPEFGVRKRDMDSFASDVLTEAMDNGGVGLSAIKDMLRTEGLDAEMDGEYGDNELVRQALERMGFDGVIDSTGRDRFNLPGMTPDTIHFIAFEPEQIKSATGNSGEFGENRNILKSVDRPQFYSQLQRAIEGAPDRLSSMAAPAWKQWLTANAPKLGVKADEVEWSGIKDYLDLRGKAKLSKDELARYLDESGVRISEVTLDDRGEQLSLEEWIKRNHPEQYSRLMEYRDANDADNFLSLKAILEREWRAGMGTRSERQTKYGQYTLPGGENYRELLITLPASEKPATREQFSVFDESGELISQGMWPPSARTQAKLDANPGWRVERETVPDQNDASRKGLYQSSHWDEPNVLAHIRVNDRTDADGKRVLFVEEVQSDWGQQGRDRGFNPAKKAPPKLIINEFGGRFEVYNETLGRTAQDEDGNDAIFGSRRDAEAMREQLLRDPYEAASGVPTAPFVTKTEGWLNLALKRIAMMAVEGGYDKVAFVNGEQSVARYEQALRKQVGQVAYNKGNQFLRVMGTDGQVLFNDTKPQSELADFLGKEVADKIEKGDNYVELTGLDLKVGGEGMKTFYDQIVPQAVNKLLPKLGGEKLGAVKILIAGNKVDITGMRTGAKRVEQPGFDVTEKMRETVGAGVPLFSKDRGYVTEDEISKMYTKAWGDLKSDKKYIDLSKAVEDAEKASNDRFQKVHKRAIEILKSRPGFSKIADEYDEKTIGNLARVFMDQADNDVPPASPSVQDALRARQEYVDYYFKEVAKIPEPREFSAQTNQQRDYYGSPAFKRWFKDSKVVNAQGKPLVAFHVTSNDFAEFDTAAGAKAGRKTTAAYSGQLGSWFTAPSLYDGNYEAGNAEAAIEGFIEGNDGAFVDGANTMPVHLSIQNPMEYSDFESMLEDRDSYKSIAAYKKDLVDQGHDGIVIRNSDTDGGVDRDDWVAFEPTQIKSAIGNNGEFDPANPDIRKSAARPYFDDLAKLKITTNYQLGDLLKTSKKLSWWDRTVGTQYNLAQKHPEFKRVFDAVQTFINDVSAYATRAADMAQDILPKLETWRDIGKAPLSAADVKALRDPIFGGTLSYTRDEEGNIVETDDVQKAGVVFTDEELRSRFNLTDKQIDLYRQFRKATDQSITDLALSDMLRYLGEDGADIREQVMASGNVDVAVGIIKSHLEGLAAAEPRRAYLLGNITSDIEDKAEQANRLMDRGYAPLSRFGQYTVYAVGQDGEQIYFSMFENERDANKMAREMREQYPDATVTTGTMSQESYKLFSGVTPETLALFGEALGLEESGIDTKSEAYQTMLKVAKTNRSAMKRLIQRKGIDGFSEDAGRVLAGFVYSNARQISTNLHAGEIGKAASSVKDGDVKDQAIRLMEYVQNPTEEAQKLKGLLFTTFLGGNISSALVNFTQTATTTFPYLSQFDSVASVTKRLGNAVKLATRGIRNDDDLKQALKRAEDEGVVSPQEVFHLMSQAQGKAQLQSGDGTRVGDALAKANNFVTKATLGWGRLFSAAEQANRRIAFIAAYQLARDKGIENPFAFAGKAVMETQFSTNKGIRPQWARGAVGGVLFTFKGFTISYLELLSRMLGNGPEGKKAFALALGTLFLFAGAGGLPFVDDLDDVVDGFAQRVLGKSFDSKQKKKEFFASIFGQTGAEFVMGGLTSLPGAPIDLSGRLGLGNIVPGSGFLPKKATYQRDAMEVFGPAGSLFSNYAAAVGALAQGDVGKAASTAAPLGIQNLIKGLDMAQMGFYRDTKGRKVIDTNGWEAFAKTLGFSPASVKRIQDATVTQQGLIAQNRLAWQEIRDLAIAGRIERDQGKIAEARQRFEDWNRKNPDSPLEWNQQSINKGVQEANKTKAQRIAAAAPKQIRQSVKQELEQAN